MTPAGQVAGLRNGSMALALLRRWGIWLALAAILVLLPQVFTSGTSLTKMSLMGIMIVFALSYNMLLGQSGMLSFGHAVYFGLGGFLVVHSLNLAAGHGLPVPVMVQPLVGGLTGLAFGIIFGSVSTRRAGTAFAMISLGIGELVASSSLILRSFFGGEEGISANRTAGLRLFDISFGPQIQVYYLIAAWCFVSILAMYALTRTPLGRMCNAVRENPERVEFVGYSTQRIRFLAFSLAGFFAGIAGGLAAINFEIMTAYNVGAAPSGVVLLMTYIGGVGHFFGPILGAILITFLQVSLSDVTGAWLLYLGLFFILMVMFAPGGIAGLLMVHEPLWRGGVLWRLLPSYLAAAVPVAMLLLGFTALIEVTHHIAVGTGGSAMHLFTIPVDTMAPGPWIVIALLLCGGFWLLGRVRPMLAAAWQSATDDLKRRGLA